MGEKSDDITCNCLKKESCPLQGKCTWSNVVYKAEVVTLNKNEGQGMLYVGLASGLWKLRLANHMASFRNVSKRDETELSKFIWELQDKAINFQIKWSILGQESPYSKESKRCRLCIREKIEIMKIKTDFPMRALNTRDTKCLHRSRHLLGKIQCRPKQMNNTQNNQLVQKESQSKSKSQNNQAKNRASTGASQLNLTSGSGIRQIEAIWGTTRSGKCWREEVNNLLPDEIFDDHG